jgi:hypothetical protein
MVKTYKFSKRWSEITKAGLAERDNWNAPSWCCAPVV